MEASAMTWVIGLFALGIGIGLGALLARTVFAKNDNRKAEILQQKLETAEQQQQDYRQQVDQHFDQSAELFQEMTDNYRRIYYHLRDGAQNLCENPPKQLEEALEGTHLVEAESIQEQLTHQQAQSESVPKPSAKEAISTEEPAVAKGEAEVETGAEVEAAKSTTAEVADTEAPSAEETIPPETTLKQPRPEEIKASDIDTDSETEMDNTEAPPTSAVGTRREQPTIH